MHKSGDTIEEHLSLVNELIRTDLPYYSHWLSAYEILGQVSTTTEVYLGPPAHMLVSRNLVNLLRNAELVEQRRPKSRQFGYKGPERQTHRAWPGLTLIVDVTAVDAEKL